MDDNEICYSRFCFSTVVIGGYGTGAEIAQLGRRDYWVVFGTDDYDGCLDTDVCDTFEFVRIFKTYGSLMKQLLGRELSCMKYVTGP